MAKDTITLKFDDGSSYTLGFTKQTVRALERKGFRIEHVMESSFDATEQLLHGAFIAHNKTLSADAIDDILSRTPQKTKLVGRLVELYLAPLTGLLGLGEDGEVEEKNEVWE